jgi:hypothetical protein
LLSAFLSHFGSRRNPVGDDVIGFEHCSSFRMYLLEYIPDK